MAIEHIGNTNTVVPGVGAYGNIKSKATFVYLGAAAEVGSTYNCFRVPSNALILSSLSRLRSLSNESSGSDIISIGLFGVNGNIIDDDTALSNSLVMPGWVDVLMLDDPYSVKTLWKFVSGQTKDPGGFLDIKIILRVKNILEDDRRIDTTLFYTLP